MDGETEAQQYLGLATLCYQRGKIHDCLVLLELSKSKDGRIPRTRFLLGKIYYEQGEIERAREEFLKAQELDPFFEEIYKHLASIFHQSGMYEKSLECLVDACILSGGENPAQNAYYQREIGMLLGELQAEPAEYTRLYRERRRYLFELADRLVVSVPTLKENISPLFLKFQEPEPPQETSKAIASELKKFPATAGLSDDQVEALAKITVERRVRKNEVIFRENDMAESIYLIHSGAVRILKQTPLGEQVLSELKAGNFFGEMDFIDSLQCSADAIAAEDSVLFAVSKVRLEELFLVQKQIAVHFYTSFWRTLSQRIRETNELMKSFFLNQPNANIDRPKPNPGKGERANVDLQEKMAVLSDKGLSSRELGSLTSFSKEEFYRAGQDIFLEGEPGDKLYIILDGEVRIGKFIPGVGEEAIAILKRGDFFGEMALVDQAPRSADARAHTDVIVLPVEKKFITAILTRDLSSAYQFLYILCKILSHRLRDINLKVSQWRTMCGGF